MRGTCHARPLCPEGQHCPECDCHANHHAAGCSQRVDEKCPIEGCGK